MRAKTQVSSSCRGRRFAGGADPASGFAADIPTFAVDASWPKPLPNNWIMGQVGGLTVDCRATSG